MTKPLTELKQAVLVNSLRSCQLFAGLSPEELAAVAAITTIRPVAGDAYLFREGEPAQGFYVVQTGAINVHRVNAAGKEQVIHVFRPGESFAEAALATDRGYPADARSIGDSQVLLVQKAGFLDLLRKEPQLALRMLGVMASHLRVLVGQIEDLTMKDVETRLANWLLKRCPDPKSETPFSLDLTMTKRVLAAELGTVSETFSRTLAKLRTAELLAVRGKRVTLLNPARLSALLARNLGG